ncbi:fumarylacetoacetate hydrolase family protein [uncultured Fusobacterium sp.]|uniref:fumarylacetoacetate hydrolase family protein n=1 Tax=Fusobacterium sp. TaxID=68766 RepID=UPI0025ECCF3B|nr:fumarylacetoacetate hydrolase family protein [uncultured Fusobacterium sp.]
MKFVRFKKNNIEKIGIFNYDETRVLDLNEILNKSFLSMIDVVENIDNKDLEVLAKAKIDSRYQGNLVKDIKICSPIKRSIHDIICVGVNYRDHLEETQKNFDKGFDKPKKIVYFSKRAYEIIGPEDSVKSRMDLDKKLDYEVELAVIIGKKGKDIPEEDVEEYIFGYSIFNDFSARELQQSHVQWYRGKSLDTYSAMGPVILHKSALPFPIEVDIKSFVNGELRQSSNTRLFLADIPKIISEISTGITLEAGDIIITGTPAGVGLGFNPPKFLKKGDQVICEIPEIGKLKNIIE